MPELLTTAEAARRIGCVRGTVTRQCGKHPERLPGLQVERSLRGITYLLPAELCTPEAWRAAVGRPGRKPQAEEG